jgi:hypothetical protein
MVTATTAASFIIKTVMTTTTQNMAMMSTLAFAANYGAAASIAGFLFFDASSTDRRSLAVSPDGAPIASMLGDGWRLPDAPYLLSLTGYVLQLFGTAIYKIPLSHTTEDI